MQTPVNDLLNKMIYSPYTSKLYAIVYMKTCVREAGIKGSDKSLHPKVSVGCDYLSLP